MDPQRPHWRTALRRGWRRRCPQCGQGPLFRKWITLHERCSACGLQILANQGDLWGFLLLVDRALFIFPIIVVLYFRLTHPDSVWNFAIGAVLVGLLVGTLPQRNGLSVGLDYLVRRRCGDLADAEEQGNKENP